MELWRHILAVVVVVVGAQPEAAVAARPELGWLDVAVEMSVETAPKIANHVQKCLAMT